MSDTSQPSDRVSFCSIIDSGFGPLSAYAARLTSCQIVMNETQLFVLAMPAGTTFGTAATEVLRRISVGQRIFP